MVLVVDKIADIYYSLEGLEKVIDSEAPEGLKERVVDMMDSIRKYSRLVLPDCIDIRNASLSSEWYDACVRISAISGEEAETPSVSNISEIELSLKYIDLLTSSISVYLSIQSKLVALGLDFSEYFSGFGYRPRLNAQTLADALQRHPEFFTL